MQYSAGLAAQVVPAALAVRVEQVVRAAVPVVPVDIKEVCDAIFIISLALYHSGSGHDRDRVFLA